MSDTYNIEGIKTNDVLAIRKLYSDLYPSIRSFLLSKGCQEQDCDDLIQDTFVDGISNIQSGKFKETSSLKTYLNSIAKFKFYNIAKKNKPTIALLDVSEEIKQEQESQLNEKDLTVISKALSQISDKCKVILEGFYYYEKNLKELAAELEISYDFIRIKKRRCMNSVKEIILKSKHHG